MISSRFIREGSRLRVEKNRAAKRSTGTDIKRYDADRRKDTMPKTIPAPADVAAPPADASTTSTGLATKVITSGRGTEHPRANSRVKVHYSGWTTDGQMFDSSVARNEPISFGLNQVISGWTEGVQLMVEGETRRLWIPEQLAYRGQRGAPQGMLVFDVELIKIES
jgi:FKBP-type peptidyl-prolyl cis-trans isomerase